MDGDLIPDFGYQSIKPCRLNEDTPYDCCYFELELDPGENYPLPVNCTEQLQISNELYDNKEICKEFHRFATSQSVEPIAQMLTQFGHIMEQVVHL